LWGVLVGGGGDGGGGVGGGGGRYPGVGGGGVGPRFVTGTTAIGAQRSVLEIAAEDDFLEEAFS